MKLRYIENTVPLFIKCICASMKSCCCKSVSLGVAELNYAPGLGNTDTNGYQAILRVLIQWSLATYVCCFINALYFVHLVKFNLNISFKVTQKFDQRPCTIVHSF